MSPTVGIVFAAAILLAVAGCAKVLDPSASRVALRSVGLPSGSLTVRLLGTAEIVVAIAALTAGGWFGAGALAAAYAAFGAFSALLMRATRGSASCGCFGGADAPVTKLHVWLNVLIASAAAWAAVGGSPRIWEAAGSTPWAGIPFVATVALLAWLLLVAFTLLPSTLTESKRTSPTPAGASAGSSAGGTTIGGLSITTKQEVHQ